MDEFLKDRLHIYYLFSLKASKGISLRQLYKARLERIFLSRKYNSFARPFLGTSTF